MPHTILLWPEQIQTCMVVKTLFGMQIIHDHYLISCQIRKNDGKERKENQNEKSNADIFLHVHISLLSISTCRYFQLCWRS